MNKILLFSALLVALYGCGGGDKPDSNTNVQPNPNVPTEPIPVFRGFPAQTYDTSYKNYKSYPIVDEIIYPEHTIRAYGEFLEKGKLSVVSVANSHAYYNAGVNAGTEAVGIYRSTITINEINQDLTLTVKQTFKGCMHAAKNIVADFNKDGAPDVFISCHGNDFILPSPGEKSNILMSDGFGNYSIKDLPIVGYFHAASAADVNQDGYPDIVVVDPVGDKTAVKDKKVYFLINDKQGSFYYDFTRINDAIANNPYYTIELIDVNWDGHVDILVGSVDNDVIYLGLPYKAVPTYILLNDGTGNFKGEKIKIPPILHKGSVMDFTFITGNGKRELFIARVDDPSSPRGGWGGWAVQHLDLDTMESTVVASSETYVMLNATKPSDWWFLKFYIPKLRDGKWGVEPTDLLGTHFFSR